MRIRLVWFFAFLLATTISGCGQKGPLYSPSTADQATQYHISQ